MLFIYRKVNFQIDLLARLSFNRRSRLSNKFNAFKLLSGWATYVHHPNQFLPLLAFGRINISWPVVVYLHDSQTIAGSTFSIDNFVDLRWCLEYIDPFIDVLYFPLCMKLVRIVMSSEKSGKSWSLYSFRQHFQNIRRNARLNLSWNKTKIL